MRPLIILALASLVIASIATPVAAANAVEVIPIGPEMKRFPIKVYISPKTSCPSDAFSAFVENFKAALSNFNQSLDAFASKYAGRFDSITLLKPVLTDREADAQIVVVFEQVEPEGAAGFTELPIADGHLAPKPKVHYDCEVITRPTVQPVNVILHEFLHALGLGHANFEELNGVRELMFEQGRPDDPVIYPSTLDLYALYMIWFGGYEGKSIELPAWLEYRMVTPTSGAGAIIPSSELSEIKKRVEELEQAYENLNATAISLGKDIKFIYERVEKLEEAQEKITQDLKSQAEEIKSHEEKIGSLEDRMAAAEEDISGLRADVSGLEARLEAEAATFEERLSALSQKLEEQQELLLDRIHHLEKVNRLLILISIILAGLSAAALTLSIKARRSGKPEG